MKVLLCVEENNLNDYIDMLAKAYLKKGVHVVYGVDNFLYSNDVPDFVHIQWPEVIYKWKYQMVRDENTLQIIKNRLEFFKNNNIPIIYTAHNKLPHDSKESFDKLIYDLIIEYTDIIVHHGKNSIREIKETFPKSLDKKHIVAPHGEYQKTSEKNLKEILQLPKNKLIICNLGSQRENKGIKFIKETFDLLDRNDVYLLNIGPYSLKENTFIHKIKIKIKIIVLKFINFLNFNKKEKTIYWMIPKDKLSLVVNSVDLFFLGHQEGLNTGLIPLSISHSKHIVFPDIGNFTEQAEGWNCFQSYKVANKKSALFALNSTIDNILLNKCDMNNKLWLAANSWNKHVEIILDNFKKVKCEKNY